MVPIAYLLRNVRCAFSATTSCSHRRLKPLRAALRVGHPLTVGISMAADEVPAPVGPEFRRIYEWQNYGHPMLTR